MINNNKLIRTCGIILVSMATLVSSLFSTKRFNKLSLFSKGLAEAKNDLYEEQVTTLEQTSKVINELSSVSAIEEIGKKTVEQIYEITKGEYEGKDGVDFKIIRHINELNVLNKNYKELIFSELKVTDLLVNKVNKKEQNLIKGKRNIDTAFAYSVVSQFVSPFASKKFPNNPVSKVLNNDITQISAILATLINIVRK